MPVPSSGIEFLKNAAWGKLWDDCDPNTIMVNFHDTYFYLPDELFRNSPVNILSVIDNDPIFILQVQVHSDATPQPIQRLIIKKNNDTEALFQFVHKDLYLQRCGPLT